MSRINVTNDDINYAATILKIPNGFDEKRVEVIKYMKSKDIVACPGSGKTTVLLAKLIILSKYLPLNNNKGVCVITHTNVAIDEIKERLGDKANELLSYPNFVGTLHSFINKFLAAPAMVKYHSTRLTRVFDEIDFKTRLIRKFNSMYPPFQGGKLAGYLFANIDQKIKDSKDRIAIEKAKETLLRSFEIDYTDNFIKRVSFNKCINVLKDSNSDSYKEYKKVITELINEGVASYNEVQGLALRYVNEFEKQLEDIFSERFPFVFVDEMQDTSLIQLQILSKIFNKEKVGFQCFGDPQQTIYESEDKGCAWKPKEIFVIKDSNRMSKSIAKVADVVSVQPYGMQGRESSGDDTIPPVIITYQDDDVSHVLETYAKIISKYKLNETTSTIFKAVGMVKNNKRLGITSYYPGFQKEEVKRKVNKDYSNLQSYLIKIDYDIVEKEGMKVYYNRFIFVFLKILRLKNIKTIDGCFFSKTSLLRYMRENDEKLYGITNRFFARAILRIEEGQSVLMGFKYMIHVILNRLFKDQVDLNVLEFLNGTHGILPIVNNIAEKENTYEYKDISIEIDSVHGVKGQTHSATLYFETFYYSKSTESIIDYLKGGTKINLEPFEDKQLRVAYVAMTRPTNLLCIVMNDDVYLQNKVDLNKLGWVHNSDVI